MNRDRIECGWKQFRLSIKQRWCKLTSYLLASNGEETHGIQRARWPCGESMKKEIITASSATVSHRIVNTITDDKNLHRHPQPAKQGKDETLACRLLPTFAVTLALCGCSSLDHRPDSAHSGSVHKTDAAEASIETSREIQPANRVVASTDTSVEPSHTIRPAEQRGHLNLHIFGLSYHPDRQGTKVNHLDNNLNAGLGLGYRLHENARGVTNIEADSSMTPGAIGRSSPGLGTSSSWEIAGCSALIFWP